MFRLIRLAFTATFGVVLGILFAKKPGKSLRTQLKKSKSPFKSIMYELQGVGKDASQTIRNSEEFKAMIDELKYYAQHLSEKAKEGGGEAIKKAQKELDIIAKSAQKAAKDLQKKGVQKAKKVTKSAQKTIKKVVKKVK